MSTRRHLSRAFTSAAVSLMMTASLLALPATTLAGLPTWRADPVISLPGTVSPGAAAGYQLTIHNDGPSNISQLYLLPADPASTPTPSYAAPSQGSCPNTGGELYCALGQLRAGADATVIVAFPTPANGSGTFSVDFVWNTTGLGSGSGDSSHGDDLPQTGMTTLSDDSDFAGGFSFVAPTGSTPDVRNAPIGSGNTQQIILSPPVSPQHPGIPVTVEDGLTGPVYCPEGGCIGEVSELHVGDGSDAYGFFKVVILISKSGTPGLNANRLVIIHVNDAGDPTTLGACPRHGTLIEECGSAANAPGGQVQVTIYLKQNGYIKYH